MFDMYIVLHGYVMFYMGTLYFDGYIMFHIVHYIPCGCIMFHVCALWFTWGIEFHMGALLFMGALCGIWVHYGLIGALWYNDTLCSVSV